MNTEQTPVLEDEMAHEAIVVNPNTPIVFDVTTQAIATMQQHAATLTIAGPEDKAGHKAVYDFRQTVADQRIAVNKRKDALKRPHIDYNKQVDAAAKALMEPMSTIEDGLAKMEKAYKDERDRLAHEQRMLLQNRTEARRKQLRDWNFAWNANNDSFEFEHSGEEVLIVNFDDMQNLPDEEYQLTVLKAQKVVETEQERLADIKRINDANEAQAKKNRQLEQDRLDKIAKEQQDEADRLQKQKDDLAKQVLESRIERLEGLGFENTPKGLLMTGFYNIPLTLLGDMSAVRFKEVINEYITWKADQDHKREETIRLGKILEARKAELEPLGFVDLIEGGMEDPYEFIMSNGQILDYTDEEFEAYKKSVVDFAEKQKQVAIDRKNADQERKKRLAPDKKILLKHFKGVISAPAPEGLTEGESTDLLGSFCMRLKNLVTECSDKVEAM